MSQHIWRIRVVCWISRAMYALMRVHTPMLSGTHMHAHTGKYVIFIAFR
jgi:hypothetical protein